MYVYLISVLIMIYLIKNSLYLVLSVCFIVFDFFLIFSIYDLGCLYIIYIKY